MAEINNASGKQGFNGRKTGNTLAARVDLTAMVDLAFLLITFFMLTTSLSQARQLEVKMPVPDEEGKTSENRTITICMGTNDRIMWYKGMLENPVIAPTLTSYGRNGIRKILADQSRLIRQSTGKEIIVAIKPGDGADFQNLVDILDEMTITQVLTFAITPATPKDKKLVD